MSEAGSSKASTFPPPQFPLHSYPRVWFFTSALTPLAIRLIRLLLAHGDYVAAGLPPTEINDEERSAEYTELIDECESDRKDREGWKDRIRGIRCNGRCISHTQAALAETIEKFGKLDILLCTTSTALVGTVEELSTSTSHPLIRAQFETIFFSQINFIKSALPLFRSAQNGHIIVLTGIGGHIGTPGMSMYCAATWALEGFCDSLAYEVAPFNVKVTIVQPNKEIGLLTNRIIFAPGMEEYDRRNNPAPGLRDVLSKVVGLEEVEGKAEEKIVTKFPTLSKESKDALCMETVHALVAIGGRENPPARLIVGHEGVASVKEKIKTVSEELEDFVEVSCAVDIIDEDDHAGHNLMMEGI